jgi:hypothetical protein
VLIKVSDIRKDSIHIRFIRREDANLEYPEYLTHTILEPIGDGGAELKGFNNSFKMTSKIYKMVLEVARQRGYIYVNVTRIKNDKPIKKTFWL